MIIPALPYQGGRAWGCRQIVQPRLAIGYPLAQSDLRPLYSKLGCPSFCLKRCLAAWRPSALLKFNSKPAIPLPTQLLPSNMAKVKLRFRDVAVNQTLFTGALNLNQHLARVRAGKQPDERVRCFF